MSWFNKKKESLRSAHQKTTEEIPLTRTVIKSNGIVIEHVPVFPMSKEGAYVPLLRPKTSEDEPPDVLSAILSGVAIGEFLADEDYGD